MRMIGTQVRQQVSVSCCWLHVVKMTLCHSFFPSSKTISKVLIGGTGMLHSWLLVRYSYKHQYYDQELYSTLWLLWLYMQDFRLLQWCSSGIYTSTMLYTVGYIHYFILIGRPEQKWLYWRHRHAWENIVFSQVPRTASVFLICHHKIRPFKM